MLMLDSPLLSEVVAGVTQASLQQRSVHVTDLASGFLCRQKVVGEYLDVLNVPWSLGLSSFADDRR